MVSEALYHLKDYGLVYSILGHELEIYIELKEGVFTMKEEMKSEGVLVSGSEAQTPTAK